MGAQKKLPSWAHFFAPPLNGALGGRLYRLKEKPPLPLPPMTVPFGRYASDFLSVAFRNNCEMDAVIVGVINSGTSLYGAIPIFSILGFKANSAFNSCMKECVYKHKRHVI